MQIREKLRHNCAAVQLPIGLEDKLIGLVDLVHSRAFYFEGPKGEQVNASLACSDLISFCCSCVLT